MDEDQMVYLNEYFMSNLSR